MPREPRRRQPLALDRVPDARACRRPRSRAAARAAAARTASASSASLAARPRHAARRPALAASGNTLAGFSSHAGSKTSLTRSCASRSAGAYCTVHQVALLDADAVLAGQAAADLDAEPQDVGAERLGLLEVARLVGVVEDQRVHVAVAGMEHVGDPEPVARGQLADPAQHERQLADRDRAVEADVVGDLAHRPERRLAPLPDQRALRRRPALAQHLGPVPPGDRDDPAPAARRSRPPSPRPRRSAAPRRPDSRHGRRPRRRGCRAGP